MTQSRRGLAGERLAKSYRSRQVVHDFSFELRPGEVVGLLGPNGAGKTTCFYMVVGLVPADRGRISMDGVDLSSLPMAARARAGLGYLPQEPSIFRRLSVEDNLLAVLELRQDLDRASRRREADALMSELQVTHLRDQLGISLSGGERRRVEIARALAGRPSYMLLDEPFAGVDPITVGEIQRLVRLLRDRGLGVLITDHNVRETLGICDRAYVLAQGSVLAAGDPQSLLQDKRVRDVYLGAQFKL
ncbi:MAG: LPS export ABC transporter ATP-binding protein [Xanthomonadales bacterium]|nr:LPS export ABC transporter ATP-binding protein [Xanthomonadales bacterium]MCB1633921.1 LPS export ABC transporter ATP-binding protein [Xanthomonadales bacterium]